MKIDGLSENSRISNFQIKHCVNTHGQCSFNITLDDTNFSLKIGDTLSVTDEDKTIFAGIVGQVQIQQVNYQLQMEVVLYTTSILWDKTKATKLFPKVSYNEIFKEIQSNQTEKIKISSSSAT